MTTRLTSALLLALSLVAAQGLAQDAPTPTPPRPADASRVPTPAEDARLVDTVARTLAGDFQLPVSDVAIEALDGDALAQILVNWGMRAELVPDVEEAAGVAMGDRVLVRADALAHMGAAERARLYAHEMTHIAQARLGASSGLTWILEGHADWVAYRLSDRLGHRSYADSLERVRRRVRSSRLHVGRFPGLGELESTEQWLHAANTAGWAATYGQAFLAVDRLIELYSEAKIRELFRRSGDADRRLRAVDERSGFADLFARRDWNAVFPAAYRDFVADFRAYLDTLR